MLLLTLMGGAAVVYGTQAYKDQKVQQVRHSTRSTPVHQTLMEGHGGGSKGGTGGGILCGTHQCGQPQREGMKGVRKGVKGAQVRCR